MSTNKNSGTIFKNSLDFNNGRNTPIQSISGVADTFPNGRNTTELQSATGDRLLFKRTYTG